MCCVLVVGVSLVTHFAPNVTIIRTVVFLNPNVVVISFFSFVPQCSTMQCSLFCKQKCQQSDFYDLIDHRPMLPTHFYQFPEATPTGQEY